MATSWGFKVFILCFVQFNEAVQGNIIWPFIPFAVQRWGAHPDEVGMYVGILASAFFFAQLLFVAVWGKAADVYGRRPTLLLGLLGTTVTMTLFGFAKSFDVALFARFLTGALNGNTAICKTYMGEITDASNISRGFAWLSFVWGFGSISAPALGGYLAEPATNYPDTFAGISFFEDFPYVLPSLIAVAFSIVAFVGGYLYLPETDVFLYEIRSRGRQSAPPRLDVQANQGNSHKDEAAGEDESDVLIVEGTPAAGAHLSPWKAEPPADASLSGSASTPSYVYAFGRTFSRFSLFSPKYKSVPAALDNQRVPGAVRATDSQARIRTRKPASIAPPEDLEEEAGEHAGLVVGGVINRTASGRSAPKSKGDGSPRSEDPRHSRGALSGNGIPATVPGAVEQNSGVPVSDLMAPSDRPARNGLMDVLKDKAVVSAVTCYSLIALSAILFDELLPVFCKTDKEEGGLGFSSNQVGTVQVFAGLTTVTFQLFIFPWANSKFGPLKCFRTCSWPMFVLAFFPAVGRVSYDSTLVWIPLVAGVVAKTGAFTMCFTSIMIAINNSSRGSGLGLINGFAQATASFVRTVAPAFGGYMYSLSMSWSSLGLWRLHVVYLMQSICMLLAFAASFRMPAWIDKVPKYSALSAAASSRQDAQSLVSPRPNDVGSEEEMHHSDEINSQALDEASAGVIRQVNTPSRSSKPGVILE